MVTSRRSWGTSENKKSFRFSDVSQGVKVNVDVFQGVVVVVASEPGVVPDAFLGMGESRGRAVDICVRARPEVAGGSDTAPLPN